MSRRGAALVFDLDGTLVDSVYQHVLAWHEALQASGFEVSVWRIHRRIGMSGGLFGQALLREIGPVLEPGMLDVLRQRHAEAYGRLAHQVRPLPGSEALLERLTAMGCPWAIATSGRMETARHILGSLPIPQGVPIITRDLVRHAKPDPDLFLAAVEKLGTDPMDTMVVGDSVWDMLAARRARMLAIGLQSGGYGTEELERAGAYRVYDDPAHLLLHLHEVGIRGA